MTWQPICLAPRDGTVILGCAEPRGGETWTGTDIWAAPKAISWRIHKAGDRVAAPAWRDAKGLACRPTHFMPLPEPPPAGPHGFGF